ncbi:MAG: MotA/TolQ/ExbB proton channel family protein [Phycisphaerales bacterium]|nr:MotA/TolQ/ExbB proton channel family protein [Phycisphaerales bacterium]
MTIVPYTLFLSVPSTGAATDVAQVRTWWDTVMDGGPVGFIIISLSIVALALCIIHFIQIRRSSLLPAQQLEEIDKRLLAGDVAGATTYCLDPVNDSFLTRVMAAGLARYQASAFGVFEIKNTIEEAGQDQAARLYRSTDGLGVIGTISPLLGLLGTVVGMVGAFESMSLSGGSNYEQLASNISMALVTTLMGLSLAIPCVALFTWFRNRIDTLASEAGRQVERLVTHLESGAMAGANLANGQGGKKS